MTSTPSGSNAAHGWVEAHLGGRGHSVIPFAFNYGELPFAELVGGWTVDSATRDLDAQRDERLITATDPTTGLVARCVAVIYRDFPAVEWTLFLKNAGPADTPILADVQAIDARFDPSGNGPIVLHHNRGSPAGATDYEPLQTLLGPRAEARFAARGGRPSDTDLPYFNLAWPGGGILLAIGWPGQWSCAFTREGDGVRVRAGQELTRFTLHPGEEVRGPLVAVLFYAGDWIDGQNLWRRWMLAHNLPHPGGQVPAPFVSAASSNQFHEMEQAAGPPPRRRVAANRGLLFWRLLPAHRLRRRSARLARLAVPPARERRRAGAGLPSQCQPLRRGDIPTAWPRSVRRLRRRRS